MALRKPAVIVGGEVENLQSGDYIIASEIPQYTNGEAGAITVGQVVYFSANDSVKKAKSNAIGTMDAVGVVYDASITNGVQGGVGLVGTVITQPTAGWDALTGDTGGLTYGAKYYVSPTTAGSLTKTAPTTAGQYAQKIGVAVSSTELLVQPGPSYLL